MYCFAHIYCWRAVGYVWYTNACSSTRCLPLALRSTELAWVSWNPNTICAARLSPTDHPGGMCLWQPAVRGFPCRQILFLKFLTAMSFERFHFVGTFHLLPCWNLETGLPSPACLWWVFLYTNKRMQDAGFPVWLEEKFIFSRYPESMSEDLQHVTSWNNWSRVYSVN